MMLTTARPTVTARPVLHWAVSSRHSIRRSLRTSHSRLPCRISRSRCGSRAAHQLQEHGLKRCSGRVSFSPELLERAFCDDAAIVDDADAFCHLLSELHDVGRQDDGAALRHVIKQQVLDRPRCSRIQPGERIIEDGYVWVVTQYG